MLILLFCCWIKCLSINLHLKSVNNWMGIRPILGLGKSFRFFPTSHLFFFQWLFSLLLIKEVKEDESANKLWSKKGIKSKKGTRSCLSQVTVRRFTQVLLHRGRDHRREIDGRRRCRSELRPFVSSFCKLCLIPRLSKIVTRIELGAIQIIRDIFGPLSEIDIIWNSPKQPSQIQPVNTQHFHSKYWSLRPSSHMFATDTTF